MARPSPADSLVEAAKSLLQPAESGDTHIMSLESAYDGAFLPADEHESLVEFIQRHSDEWAHLALQDLPFIRKNPANGELYICSGMEIYRMLKEICAGYHIGRTEKEIIEHLPHASYFGTASGAVWADLGCGDGITDLKVLELLRRSGQELPALIVLNDLVKENTEDARKQILSVFPELDDRIITNDDDFLTEHFWQKKLKAIIEKKAQSLGISDIRWEITLFGSTSGNFPRPKMVSLMKNISSLFRDPASGEEMGPDNFKVGIDYYVTDKLIRLQYYNPWFIAFVAAGVYRGYFARNGYNPLDLSGFLSGLKIKPDPIAGPEAEAKAIVLELEAAEAQVLKPLPQNHGIPVSVRRVYTSQIYRYTKLEWAKIGAEGLLRPTSGIERPLTAWPQKNTNSQRGETPQSPDYQITKRGETPQSPDYQITKRGETPQSPDYQITNYKRFSRQYLSSLGN